MGGVWISNNKWYIWREKGEALKTKSTILNTKYAAEKVVLVHFTK